MELMQRSLTMALTSCLVVTTFVHLAGESALCLQQLDRSQAEKLEEKIQLIRERHEKHVQESEDFEVSEDEANAYISFRLIDRLPEGVLDPWVRFSDGPVTAGAMLDLSILRERMPNSSVAQLLSGQVPVELAARVHAENGVGKLTMDRITLGGFPVPESLLQQIVTAYTKSPSQPQGIQLDEPFTLPYGITSARVEQGRIRLRQSGSRESPGVSR
jgi:hypothetical protein